MKSKIVISGLSAALLLTALPVLGQSQEDEAPAGPPAPAVAEVPAEVETGETCPLDNPFGCMFGSLAMVNPMDPSMWYDGSEGMEHDPSSVNYNPMDPDFMLQLPNPETHTPFHMAMTNPENWAQFMTPEAVLQMMDPESLAKWMDPESYEALADPQLYAYWAQPGAYLHAMEPEHYAQLMNPTAYMNLFKEVVTSWAALAEAS